MGCGCRAASSVFIFGSIGVALVAVFVAWWLKSQELREAFEWRTPRAFEFNFSDGYSAYNSSDGWATIPRLQLENLTHQRVVQEFIKARRPFVLTGIVADEPWSFEGFVRECGNMEINFHNHYMHALSRIPKVLYPYINSELQSSFGVDANISLESIYRARKRRWNIHTYGQALKRSRQMSASPRQWRWMLDYLWPPSVHSIHLLPNQKECRGLRQRIKPIMDRIEHVLFGDGGAKAITDAEPTFQELYVAPAASRAYPLHQHGDINENFVMMLSGSKRVVVFPPPDDIHLYERPEFSTEYGDRVFLAEAFSPSLNLARQPGLAKARGAEGIVRPGEVVYIPANSIHAVENIDNIVAIAMHVSATAPAFQPSPGRQLEECITYRRRWAERKAGYSSGFAWRLLRSLPGRIVL